MAEKQQSGLTIFTVTDDFLGLADDLRKTMDEEDILACIKNHSSLALTPENRRIFNITNVIVTPILVTVGLIANILTIFILGKVKARQRNAVDLIMIILAVCDVSILLLTLPGVLGNVGLISRYQMFTTWMLYYKVISYEIITTLDRFLLWLAAMLATVRYLVISKPFRCFRRSNRGRILIVAFVVLILTIILSIPNYLSIQVQEISTTCAYGISKVFVLDFTELGASGPFLQVYPYVTTAVFFVLPFTAMLISNILLVYCVHQSVSQASRLDAKVASRRKRSELRITVLVCLIILNYFITVFPKCLGEVYIGNGIVQGKNRAGFRAYFLVVNCLSLLDASVNLLLYSVLSSDFRRTFQKTFCCCLRNRKRRGSKVKHDSVNSSVYSERDSVFSCVPCRGSFRFLSRKITVRTIGPIQVHDQADVSNEATVRRTTCIGKCSHKYTDRVSPETSVGRPSPRHTCRHTSGGEYTVDNADLYIHLRTCINWEHLEETKI